MPCLPSPAGALAAPALARRLRPGQIPRPPDPPDRPLAARRLGRCAAALAGGAVVEDARPAGAGGEPARGLRHPRRAVPDDPGEARWLHPGADAHVDRAPALYRPHAALGRGGRLHPYHRPVRLDVRHRGEGGRADQVLGRLPRLCPRQSGAADLCDLGHRHHQPPGDGGAGGAGEDRAGACPLPRRQRIRGRGRLGRGDVRRRRVVLGAAGGRRAAAADLRLDRRAVAALPGCADPAGAGLRHGRSPRPTGSPGRRGWTPAWCACCTMPSRRR